MHGSNTTYSPSLNKINNIILLLIPIKICVLHYVSRKRSKWQPNTKNKIQNRREQNLQRALSLFIRLIPFYWIVSFKSSLIAGRKEAQVALGIHRVAITAPAYLRLGSPRSRVNLYASTIYREMGKGWYGIASHQGTPCGSCTYRLRGRLTRLVTLAILPFSSPLRHGVYHISRDRKDRDKRNELHRGKRENHYDTEI